MLCSVKEYLDCRLCELSHYRGRSGYEKLVTYKGADAARVCLIGEGPGENEAREGVPFIGKAGEFLDTILNKVAAVSQDLLPNNCHICNSVLCRAPNNRKPSTKEVIACSSRLVREIAEVGAKLVVCLGATALAAITTLDKITVQRGRILQSTEDVLNKNFLTKWKYYNGDAPNFHIGITIHPASIFYGSKEEQENRSNLIEQDFIKFAHWLKVNS